MEPKNEVKRKTKKPRINQSLTSQKLVSGKLNSMPQILQYDRTLSNLFFQFLKRNHSCGYNLEIEYPSDEYAFSSQLDSWVSRSQRGDILFILNREKNCWTVCLIDKDYLIKTKCIETTSVFWNKLSEINSQDMADSKKSELKTILELNPLFENYHNPSLVNEILPNGETPLHYAIRKGDLFYIKSLILCGADVNKIDNFGLSPLHVAVMTNFDITVDIIKFLLKKGAVLNNNAQNSNCSKDTPLHFIFRKIPWTLNDLNDALEKTDLEIAMLSAIKLKILECFFASEKIKIDVNERDHNGRTLLHHAMLGTNLQKVALIEFLISKKADVNIKDKFNETPNELQDRLKKEDKFFTKDAAITEEEIKYNQTHGLKRTRQEMQSLVKHSTSSNPKYVFWDRQGRLIAKDIFSGQACIIENGNQQLPQQSQQPVQKVSANELLAVENLVLSPSSNHEQVLTPILDPFSNQELNIPSSFYDFLENGTCHF